MTDETHTPAIGAVRLARVVNRIIQHPECWDQSDWHSDCGTAHCIAGHGQIAAGKEIDRLTACRDAREFFAISNEHAQWLFCGDRTLPEIHRFALMYLQGLEVDSDGYDRAGYDRAGYDSDGYDRCGYDRYGYDRAGYDRAGYDSDGYDSSGNPLPLLPVSKEEQE